MAGNHETSLRQNVVSLHSEGSSGSSLRTQEHLSVKHALPKTRVTHTILHENVSQDRQLAMVMKTLNHRQRKCEGLAYQSRNTFLHRQKRKEEKWKREDNGRIQSLKFPTIRNYKSENRPGSMLIMYRKPRYPLTASDDIQEAKPPDLNGLLLPITEITPERTEIVTHREKTFITKLPPVVKVDELKLKRFHTYCGSGFLERNLSKKADQFKKLTGSLSCIPSDFEKMTMENLQKLHDQAIGKGSEDPEQDEEEEQTDETSVKTSDVDSDAGREMGDNRKTPQHDEGRSTSCSRSRSRNGGVQTPCLGDGNIAESVVVMKTPEPTLYEKLKIDRDCMFPMLKRLSQSSEGKGSLLRVEKESEKPKNAFKKWSRNIIRDIKTKNIVELTKRYGLLATVNTRRSQQDEDEQEQST